MDIDFNFRNVWCLFKEPIQGRTVWVDISEFGDYLEVYEYLLDFFNLRDFDKDSDSVNIFTRDFLIEDVRGKLTGFPGKLVSLPDIESIYTVRSKAFKYLISADFLLDYVISFQIPVTKIDHYYLGKYEDIYQFGKLESDNFLDKIDRNAYVRLNESELSELAVYHMKALGYETKFDYALNVDGFIDVIKKLLYDLVTKLLDRKISELGTSGGFDDVDVSEVLNSLNEDEFYIFELLGFNTISLKGLSYSSFKKELWNILDILIDEKNPNLHLIIDTDSYPGFVSEYNDYIDFLNYEVGFIWNDFVKHTISYVKGIYDNWQIDFLDFLINEIGVPSSVIHGDAKFITIDYLGMGKKILNKFCVYTINTVGKIVVFRI